MKRTIHIEWNEPNTEMVKALKRAVPWLGKMIADKAHLNSVAPNDCVGALQQAEAVLKKHRISA